MMLSWDQAAVLALLLALAGIVVRPAGRHWVAVVTAACRETSLILALFSIWQLAGRLSLLRLDDAKSHALWIWNFQQAIHLPSEITIQRFFLPHPMIVKAFNVYYATMHFPGLIVFLIWLWARHREHYPPVRNVIAMSTAACLLIQLFPVAPPRMFAELGFVDTALRYGQSVYGPVGSGFADQLSAMPSVHVGWAVLVGAYVINISPSKWRWLVLVHTFLTILIVTVTANHWWLDGVVAVLLFVIAIYVERWCRMVITRMRPRATLSPVLVSARPVSTVPE